MTEPRPLSPAALAVVDAVMMHQFGVASCLSRNERMRSGGIAAAALRAAAAEMHGEWGPDHCIDTLRAIANELDPHD